jgi:hypothetical protein
LSAVSLVFVRRFIQRPQQQRQARNLILCQRVISSMMISISAIGGRVTLLHRLSASAQSHHLGKPCPRLTALHAPAMCLHANLRFGAA